MRWNNEVARLWRIRPHIRRARFTDARKNTCSADLRSILIAICAAGI
jgi:hypothetical protein